MRSALLSQKIIYERVHTLVLNGPAVDAMLYWNSFDLGPGLGVVFPNVELVVIPYAFEDESVHEVVTGYLQKRRVCSEEARREHPKVVCARGLGAETCGLWKPQ